MARAAARKTGKAKATTGRGGQRAKKTTAPKKPAKRHTATPAGRSDKEHLIALIRQTTGCTAKAAKETLDGVIGTITASLKKNQKVQLIGFGSFEVKKRPARKARNPRTGEAIRVKASKSVRFKAGQTLKRSV